MELAKAMGFNGVRKHQKIEDPRYLYWADVLGLLVWEEMPSAYRFTSDSVERVTQEWTAAIDRDYSHPCIVAWVPINESWGVPNLPDIPAERHYVQALYHLTRTLDPTRPVIGNDGWESVATDIIGIHDYDADPGEARAPVSRRSRGAAANLQARAARRPPAGARGRAARGPSDRAVASSAASRSPGAPGPGAIPMADGDEDLALRYERLLRGGAIVGAACAGSATRSSPTHTRRPTACCIADRTPKIPLRAHCGGHAGPCRPRA